MCEIPQKQPPKRKQELNLCDRYTTITLSLAEKKEKKEKQK